MNSYKRVIYSSPQVSKRSTNIIKDDKIVCLINTLNLSIKTYYDSLKLSLSQIKDSLSITQHPIIEPIETSLIAFIKDAKEIFKKLKAVHSKSRAELDPLNEFFNSTRSPPIKKSFNVLSPGVYLTTSPLNERVNIFSESNQRHMHQTTKQITNIYNNNTNRNSDNHHQVLSLANGVISFLTKVMQFEDSVMKKKDDVKEKKKQFEILKNNLLLLAKGILDSSHQHYATSQESKKSSNGNSTSKDKDNNANYNSNNSNNKSNVNRQEDIQLKNNIKGKTTNTNSNPLFVNKMKSTVQMLQKENRELMQKINELNEMQSINSGTTTLINRLKGYELEIKKFKEMKLKTSFDKGKGIDDKLKVKDTKIQLLTNTNKEYEQLIEQKEKIILILKEDVKQVSNRLRNKDNELKRETKNKSSDINHYKELILRSDSNGLASSINNCSPSYSHIYDESTDKQIKRIQELTNELNTKTKELEKIKEEDEQKDKEISYCVRELGEIKEMFVTENAKLKEDLKNMEKDNNLLTDELKILNDHISKIDKEIKADNHHQSPHDNQLFILAKNTIEYKKVHDELYKERKEKNELLNNKKLLKQEITKLTNELLKRNKEVEILSSEVNQMTDRLSQLNSNYPLKPIEEEYSKHQSIEPIIKYNSSSMLNSGNVTNSTELNKRPSHEKLVDHSLTDTISKKTTQKELLSLSSSQQSNELKEKLIKIQSENVILLKTVDTLNEKLIEKEKTITQFRDKIDLAHNTVSKELLKKNEEITSLNKKMKEENESYDILKGIIREKENTIADLNNKESKIAAVEKTLELEKAKLTEHYEQKIKNLSVNASEIKEADIRKTNAYIQLQNELKELQSTYDSKCTMLNNKNNQMDVLSTQNFTNEKEIKNLKNIIQANIEEIELLNKKLSSQAIELTSRSKPQHRKEEEREEAVQKDNIISYETHRIICDKNYDNLHWYLISPNDINDNKQKNYLNTYWIESNKISQDLLCKFNKFKAEKEIEEEALSHLSVIQSQLLRKLEDKDNEVINLQKENKQLNDRMNNANINLTGDISKERKNTTIDLNLFSPRDHINENATCYIPIEKYNKLIIEINEVNDKLNKSNAFVTKLKNENKELSKLQDESKAPKIDHGLSFINTEKDNHSFFDDELKDVINIPECRQGRGIEGCFNELRTLVQILIHEMTYTSRIKKILIEICKLIGFTEENTFKMITEKEKKGGILNMFKKK